MKSPVVMPTSADSGPLTLISTASTDPTNPPVIMESVLTPIPDEQKHLWRPSTDDEYAAYLTYWSDDSKHEAPSVERVLYDDEDGTDLLIDGRHNVNFVPGLPSDRMVTHEARDGSPMRVEIHPTGRHWYVEVKR